MKMSDIIKNLILGFWKNGLIALCRVVAEHWIISLLIILLITYLCSNPATAIYAWFLVGVFALYSAVKALIEIFIEIRNYIKSENTEIKPLIIRKIGGKIFDFLLCMIGVLQSLRVFSHTAKITKTASSAVNVIDDVASAISRFLKDLK